MRTSSGVVRMRIDVTIVLMQLDLPAPVWPAMSTCGNVARFANTALPGDVAAHADFERELGLLGFRAAQDVAQCHDRAHLVRDFDTDRAAARNRGEDSHVVARHRVRDLLGEARHLADLDTGRELQLVTRDRRSHRRVDESRVDAEFAHRGLEHVAALLDHARVDLALLALLQNARRGKLPHDLGHGPRHARVTRRLRLLRLLLRTRPLRRRPLRRIPLRRIPLPRRIPRSRLRAYSPSSSSSSCASSSASSSSYSSYSSSASSSSSRGSSSSETRSIMGSADWSNSTARLAGTTSVGTGVVAPSARSEGRVSIARA